MANLDLWNTVEETKPSHTKKVTFGRAITAIDPYHQIRNATAQFGPVGEGWGYKVVDVHHLPTNEICVIIEMWTKEPSNTFCHAGQASYYIDKKEEQKDKDCMKKAITDGVTKCLSILGFNADIFLGKFDDNKYYQEQVQKETKANKVWHGPKNKGEHRAAMKVLNDDLETCTNMDDLNEVMARHSETWQQNKKDVPSDVDMKNKDCENTAQRINRLMMTFKQDEEINQQQGNKQC